MELDIYIIRKTKFGEKDFLSSISIQYFSWTRCSVATVL